MTLRHSHMAWVLLVVLSGLLLTGCPGDSDDDDDAVTARYRVTVTNLTANQPLSPLAVVAHTADYHGWSMGQPASEGLEYLAEGGSTAEFLAEAMTIDGVKATAAGGAPFGPGATQSVVISVEHGESLFLTIATMLVNTNDCFTGFTHQRIDALEVGDKATGPLQPFDAGTEANSETASTVPGPAAGGEGFNPARDDLNKVVIHSGVISASEGLPGSALDQSHRFDTPVAVMELTRLEN